MSFKLGITAELKLEGSVSVQDSIGLQTSVTGTIT